ncbi:hypothetical protein B0A49_11683 [Cryomyces minteri]|uniref:DUF3500 domain-containing protein n=1 Tax=Cryomyces minteri TaxID=331657 RepID=A0A4U0WJ74_9PEZI|nr:hypothetical protein B0A49_11683 [Cryomyces minteri]
MSTTDFERSAAGFRQYLPNLNTPRFQVAREQNAYQYAETLTIKRHPPWLYSLTQTWQQLLEEPYKGVTTDGHIIPNLFPVQDEGVPIARIVAAAKTLLDQLTPTQQTQLSYPLNAKEWRAWSNPEFLLRPLGLRLEELSSKVALSILTILRTTLSPEGYEKAISAMRINQFLGQICHIPKVMNQYSYNFLLFGTPSTSPDAPWGWSLYGHHLALNVFLRGPQIVISPTFTGAEPNIIDEGPFAGTQILHVEGELGLKLMQSLPEEWKAKAQSFKLMRDPGMLQTGDLVVDRWNPDDQRHVCGAFRDNRVVPYEGICVAECSPQQQQLVLDIAYQFVLYLPTTARKLRLEQVERHFEDTFFSWIGGWGDNDPFYFRIQSPVVLIEFDHHSGVFLSNTEPAKFHTHTILLTPNGGDYGAALRMSKEKLR